MKGYFWTSFKISVESTFLRRVAIHSSNYTVSYTARPCYEFALRDNSKYPSGPYDLLWYGLHNVRRNHQNCRRSLRCRSQTLKCVTIIKEAEEAGTWHVTFYVQTTSGCFLNSSFPINYSLRTLNLDRGSIVHWTIFKELGSKPKKFSPCYESIRSTTTINSFSCNNNHYCTFPWHDFAREYSVLWAANGEVLVNWEVAIIVCSCKNPQSDVFIVAVPLVD